MRFRWFDSRLPFSLRTMASRLKQHSYTQDRGSGFILQRVRDAFVEGSFAERVQYADNLRDPFGNETTIVREVYRNTDFTISDETPTLELRDPPKSVQLFVNSLSEVSDFGMSISRLDVDPIAWMVSLQEALGFRVLVDSMHLSKIDLGDGIAAKIVVSGPKDVRSAVRELTAKKKHVVERIGFRLNSSENSMVKISLASMASAKVDGSGAAEFSKVLRSSLA